MASPNTVLNTRQYNDVVIACNTVNAHWRDLGTRLGVLVHALDTIEANCNGKVERCMGAMITKWLQRPLREVRDDVRPTWRSLCVALSYIDRPLADRLAEEHDCGDISMSGSGRTTTQPTQSPETYSQTTEIKAIVSCIKKELDGNYSNLKSVFQVSMEQVSDEMFTVGLISIAVKKKQSYDALIDEFYSGFLFMKELPQVEQHCKKFFDVFYKLGGSFVIAGDVLKQSITQTIKDKFNLNLSFD